MLKFAVLRLSCTAPSHKHVFACFCDFRVFRNLPNASVTFAAFRGDGARGPAGEAPSQASRPGPGPGPPPPPEKKTCEAKKKHACGPPPRRSTSMFFFLPVVFWSGEKKNMLSRPRHPRGSAPSPGASCQFAAPWRGSWPPLGGPGTRRRAAEPPGRAGAPLGRNCRNRKAKTRKVENVENMQKHGCAKLQCSQARWLAGSLWPYLGWAFIYTRSQEKFASVSPYFCNWLGVHNCQ